jgi:hypothetical protein
VVRVLVLRHGGREVDDYRNRHGGHDLELHLYMYVARESALSHHDVRVVRESVHHRCTYAGRVLELRRDVRDLLARHRDGRVVRESVLRRCTCEVRVLGVHLRNDCGQREFRLAFRHLCVVVCPKDSTRHYCAWRHELRRAVIRRGCGHPDRVVRGIRPWPP